MNTRLGNINEIEDYFLMADRGKIYASAIGIMEKMLIEKALERSDGNQIAAAKMLGIHRNTLHMKLKKFNIDTERFKQ